MPMTELSVEQRYQQINTFVGLFVIEFMEEIAFLESVSRGNAQERKNASMVILFNISCALVSLVPIPGITLGFVALPHVVNAVVDIGKLIVSQPLIQEAMTTAQDYLKDTLTSEIQDRLTLTPPALSVTENNQSVDKEIMQVLVHWVGTQLSCRYEQVLTERLSIQATNALADLAREAARRSVAFLAENRMPYNSQVACMRHLLDGVAIGQKVKWYLRPFKFFHKKKLQGRDEAASLTFDAASLLAGGVWFQDDAFYTHSEIKWIKKRMLFPVTGLEGLPRYGYTQGWVEKGLGLTKYTGETPDFSEWKNRRMFHAITKKDLIDYLNSCSVQIAKANKSTALQTLTEFLHARSPSHFPAYANLYIAEDLRDLTFAHGNFQGINFSGSTFSGDFSYANFSDGKFYACSFYNVLSDISSSVIFTCSALSFSYFIDTKFNGIVNFVQAELCGVDFGKTKFGKIDHVGANWHRANLQDVQYEGLLEVQKEQIKEVLIRQQRQEDSLIDLNKRIMYLEDQYIECRKTYPLNLEQQKKIDDLFSTEINFMAFEAYTKLQLEKLQKKNDAENKAAISDLAQQLESHRRTITRLVLYDKMKGCPSRFYKNGLHFNKDVWIVTFVNEHNTIWELFDKSLAEPSIVIEGIREDRGVPCIFTAKYTLAKNDHNYEIRQEEFDTPINDNSGVMTKSGNDFIDNIVCCSKGSSCSYKVHKGFALKMIENIKKDAIDLSQPRNKSTKPWTVSGFFYDRLTSTEDPIKRFICGNSMEINLVTWCLKKLTLANIYHVMPLRDMASSATTGSSVYQKKKPEF